MFVNVLILRPTPAAAGALNDDVENWLTVHMRACGLRAQAFLRLPACPTLIVRPDIDGPPELLPGLPVAVDSLFVQLESKADLASAMSHLRSLPDCIAGDTIVNHCIGISGDVRSFPHLTGVATDRCLWSRV